MTRYKEAAEIFTSLLTEIYSGKIHRWIRRKFGNIIFKWFKLLLRMLERGRWILDMNSTWAVFPPPPQQKESEWQCRLNFVVGDISLRRWRGKKETPFERDRISGGGMGMMLIKRGEHNGCYAKLLLEIGVDEVIKVACILTICKWLYQTVQVTNYV